MLCCESYFDLVVGAPFVENLYAVHLNLKVEEEMEGKERGGETEGRRRRGGGAVVELEQKEELEEGEEHI